MTGLIMTCDGIGCRTAFPPEPLRAPRLIVPSRTGFAPGHKPFRIMTALHYCSLHTGQFDLAAALTDALKARAEQVVRKIRPLGFKLEFDATRVEWVLVTTPEYRAFLTALATREDRHV